MEVLQRTANRGSISTGYDIDNSIKFESDNAEYLDNRHHNAGNRRTWTLSFWIKRTELGTTQKPYDAGNAASIAFLSTDKIQIENHNLYLVTNRVFRDTSAWYHIVQLNDSTQSTASDRAKLWINGVQETSFSSETYMAQNEEGYMNSATSVSIGGGGGAHVNGYMAELFFVDGQALAPTDFGEFDEDSGIWKPKEYDGTLSGTSLKLDFSNSAALWEDSSGLSGNGTAMSGNNITSANQATDTPTNNFATFNILSPTYGTSVISEGGTKAKGSGQNTFDNIQSTIAVTKGKWYCELEPQVDSAAQNTAFGVVNLDTAVFSGDHYAAAGFWSGGFDDGRLIWYFFNGSGAGTETVNYGTGAGDTAGTIGMAFDLDNGTLKFYIRNTQTTISASSLPAGTYAFFGDVMGTNAPYLNFNFGGYTVNSISSAASDANGYGTFEYAPPTGYYALCTKNLAEYG